MKLQQLNHFSDHTVNQLRELLWVKISQQNTVHRDLPTCKSSGGCTRKGMWRNLGRHKASDSALTLWLEFLSMNEAVALSVFHTGWARV